MSFQAYILRCSDDTLYCGSTPDLEKRLNEHNGLKSGAKYTRGRRPVALAYCESFETLSEARKKECALKKLNRKQKTDLIDWRKPGNEPT